jgi:hypothetical protein
MCFITLAEYMKRILKILSLLFILIIARASFADAQGIPATVIPLLDGNSFLVGHNLAFQLKSTNQDAIELVGVTIADPETARRCPTVIDPFIKQNFLINCDRPSAVTVLLAVRKNGNVVGINYGPFNVRAIPDGNLVVPPPPTPTPSPLLDQARQGKNIYNGNCKSCHVTSAVTSMMLRTQTVLTLRNKQATTTSIAMRAAIGGLNDSQLQLLVIYLGNQELVP